MTTPLTATDDSTLDLRLVSPRDRPTLIFARLNALQTGESLQLLNDHAPRPLRSQFEDRAPGQFSWSPLETGPVLWRTQISRLASAAAVAKAASTAATTASAGSCCSGGACCG